MTSSCLWHACRALALGLLLMLIGAGMATIGQWNEKKKKTHTQSRENVKRNGMMNCDIELCSFTFPSGLLGYYAEHISRPTETHNSTVRVKPDSKSGIHLHNLSYAGPIVMGCGGKKSSINFIDFFFTFFHYDNFFSFFFRFEIESVICTLIYLSLTLFLSRSSPFSAERSYNYFAFVCVCRFFLFTNMTFCIIQHLNKNHIFIESIQLDTNTWT